MIQFILSILLSVGGSRASIPTDPSVANETSCATYLTSSGRFARTVAAAGTALLALVPGARGEDQTPRPTASVFATTANANSPRCTLITNDQDPEAQAAWRRLGYRVDVRADLATLAPAARANLLGDASVALIRDAAGDSFQLGVTNGSHSRRWSPARVRPPARGAVIDGAYSCLSITARLPLYRASRAAVVDVLRLAEGQTIDRTRGEAIVDLERSYLVQNGAERFENDRARSAYLALFERVNNLPETDFFTRWWQVRRLVYGSRNSKLKSCPRAGVLTAALLDHCADAQAETYLMTALFLDAGFTPPAGWRLGVQRFEEHVRPVLLNTDLGQIFDLVTGARGPAAGAVANVEALYRQLFLGHDRLRFAEEMDRARNVPIEYAHRGWNCLLRSSPAEPIGPMRAADLGAIASCGHFALSLDQNDKARRPSFDQAADEQIAADTDAAKKAPATSARSKSRTKDGVGSFAYGGHGGGGGRGPGLLSTLSNILSGIFTAEPDPMTEAQAEMYRRLAENLIPRERALVMAYADRPLKTFEAFSNVFSTRGVLAELGFEHLVRSDTDRKVLNPVHVQHVPDIATERLSAFGIKLSSAGPEDTVLGTCPGGFGKCLRSTDQSLITELLAQSAADRIVTITRRLLVKRLSTGAARARVAGGFGPELNHILDGATTREALDAFSQLTSGINAVGAGLKILLPSNRDENTASLEGVLWGLVSEDTNLRAAAAVPLAVANQLESNALSVLRWMVDDPARRTKLFGLEGLVATLDQTLTRFRDVPVLESAFHKWNVRTEAARPVADAILLGVLTDSRYFATIEADADEIVSVRPFYPLRQMDERVREVKSDRHDEPVPDVNLPKIAGLSCPPGGRGWYRSGSFAVECRRGSPDAPDADGNDGRSRSGIFDGTPTGRERGVVRTDDDRTRAGVTRRPTAGRDSRGDKIIENALTPKREAYPRADAAPSVRDGIDRPTEYAPDILGLDPRPELELPPDAWTAVLGAVDRAAFAEPLIKVLMHHAYRRKMGEIYAALPATSALRLIEFSDVDEPDLVLGGEDDSVATDYLGLRNSLFVRAARADLNSPKAGHVVTTRRIGPGIEDELRLLEDLAHGRRPGRTVPGRHSNGIPLFQNVVSILSGNSYSRPSDPYFSMSDDLASILRPLKKRRYYRGDGGRSVMFRQSRGGIFGSETVAFYHLDDPGFATRAQRRHLVTETLKVQ